MRIDYKEWLTEQKYSSGTIDAQLHRVGRVEDAYGNLDSHFAGGTLQDIIDELEYSVQDERRDRENPSKISINGNLRNNLQSYKNAVVRYRKFLTGWERSDIAPPARSLVAPGAEAAEEDAGFEPPVQKLSLERDMQAALRLNIRQLSERLAIVDDGAERSVHSGLIDNTCEDSSDNALVVVELKAGKADGRAIGQILGYMGDLAEEEPDRPIRGILVAHEFDKRSRSAARAGSTLSLMRYSVAFRFELEEQPG